MNNTILVTYSTQTTLEITQSSGGRSAFGVIPITGISSIGTPVGDCIIQQIDDGTPSISFTMSANTPYFVFIGRTNSYSQYGAYNYTLNNIAYSEQSWTNTGLIPYTMTFPYKGVSCNTIATSNSVTVVFGGGNGGDTTGIVSLYAIAIPLAY